MAKPLIDDALWNMIEPLLPKAKPRRFDHPGRKPVEARAALTGILFVLRSSIPWRMLPLEMGCGSGSTCWRRLRDWQKAGVWERLRRLLLDQLQQAHQLDWSRAVVDSSSVRAVGAGKKNRAKPDGQTKAWQQTSRRRRRARRAFAFLTYGC